jgi:ethanolamine utilization microcompartment shell protein EutS
MRAWSVLVCAAIVLAAASGPAAAGDRIGIGVKFGTLGFGLDITGRVNDWFSVRGTFNAADANDTHEESGVEYETDVAFGASGLLFDFHPWKNNFRLTAGWMHNRTGADLLGTPTENVEIGDTVYTPAEAGTISGDVAFKDSAGYVGFGYGSAARGPGRVRFVLDVGALLQGTGAVTLSSSTGLVSQDDLAKEEQDLEDDLDDLSFYPVLALGISFRL